MILLKSYRHLIFFLAIPVVILAFLLFWETLNIWSKVYLLHWPILALALGISLSPWGNRQLAANTQEETARYSLGSWFLQIILLQASLYGLFFVICQVSNQTLPILIPPQAKMFSYSLQQLLLKDGLYPWGLIATIGTSFAYISYRLQKDAYFSDTINPLIANEPRSALGVIFNFNSRLVSGFAIASSLLFVALLFVGQFTPQSIGLATGFNTTVIVNVTLLLILVVTRYHQQYLLKYLSTPPIPPIITFFIWLMLFTLVLFVLNLLIQSFGQNSISVPQLIQALQAQNWLSLWAIFTAAWWISWTALISIVIGRLSRGRKIRSLILATLILPFISAIGTYYYQRYQLDWHLPPAINCLIAIFSILVLLYFITQERFIPSLILNYLPRTGQYKKRSYQKYFSQVTLFTVALLYFFLPAGIFALAPLECIVVLVFSVFCLLSVIGLVKLLYNNKKAA